VQEKPLGCVETAKGPIENETLPAGESKHQQVKEREGTKLSAKVGRPAPDFEANAFVNGGFTNIRLSSLKGQWVLLCFYPGDFTFV